MRLRRLDLTRYGKFTDYPIDFGEHVAGRPDLHIIYGLNEAGKSTSLSAYLDLLFGIEERTKYGFLHQGKAMEIGACLEFGGQSHEFRRVKQRSNSLLDAHGQPVTEAILSAPLGGLTRDAYRVMFSLDDQTLEDGGNAILESKGDLGELLFSASSGLAGINSILEVAVAEADAIFRKRASSTRIAVLKRQIAELRSQRDEIDIQASSFRALTAALEQAAAAYDATMTEIATARTRQDDITRILHAHPLAADYRRTEEELQAYQDLPHPPHRWAFVLPDLIIEETRLQTELSGIQQREARICEELEGLVVSDRLIEMADDLDHLPDAAARYATAQEDLPKRKEALFETRRKIDLILATLGKTDINEPKSLLIPAGTIGALRDLISERSGVMVARQSAEKEYDAARQVLEKELRARQALDSQAAQLDAGKVAQLQSLLSGLRDSNLAAEMRLAERNVLAKRHAFEDAVRTLQPWTGNGDDLRRISMPPADRVETWKSTFTALVTRRAQLIDRERELATRQQECATRLSALRKSSNIVDDEEAQTALLERDTAWKRHLSTLDQETASHFEIHMQKADAVAAARLDRARELEELRALASELAMTIASGNRQRELLLEADDDLEALRSEIRSETPREIHLNDDGTAASWLAAIGHWTESRDVTLAAWDDLRRASNELDATKAALAAQRESLTTSLTRIGIDAEVLELPALVQAADNALANDSTLRSKRLDADKRIGELDDAAEQRKAALDEAVTGFNEWQSAWEAALAATWFTDQQGSISAVRELLDAIAGLPEVLREQDDLQYRISAMEADQNSFADTVVRLNGALGDMLDVSNPLTAARELIQRHEEARQIEARRQERDQARLELSIERERLDSEVAMHDARKTEMTSFFRVETLADVRLALERCRKRNELVEEQAKLKRQILNDMQAQSLQDALVSLADTDLSELRREQAELVTRIEDLDGRAKDQFADKARASDRLAAIGGDDAVARLEAKRRTLLLEIEDQALRYLRLRSGSLVADFGIRAYREKHRSTMMNRASEAFRLITRDEYIGLATRPDKDREVLIAIMQNGGSKVATELSKGTQFQLYLALRLAGYEEFAAARPSVPFIADDIMETFDEPRSEEVLRLFGQMAEIGQVIYLTHHRHLCEIAAQVVPQVRIHEIS